MTISSLKRVITGSFVSGLTGSGEGDKPRSPLAKKDDGASVDVSLRTGARNFAMGLQAINAGITYVQVSKQTNEQLLGVIDRLDLLLSKAAKGNLGSSTAKTMIKEFQDLGRTFQQTIKDAKVRDSDILDPNDLSAQLAKSGLDPEKIDTLSKTFAKLTSLTKTTVDENGEVTSAATLIPVSSFTNAVRRAVAEFESGIDSDPNASELEQYAGTFRRIRDELKGARGKLEQNIKALDLTLDVLGKNVQLARATGLAMLELSQSVRGNESPEDVAERLRQQITSSVPAALSQSNNLSAIMVAGLTMVGESEKAKKKA
jgi:hypothetical protein